MARKTYRLIDLNQTNEDGVAVKLGNHVFLVSTYKDGSIHVTPSGNRTKRATNAGVSSHWGTAGMWINAEDL